MKKLRMTKEKRKFYRERYYARHPGAKEASLQCLKNWCIKNLSPEKEKQYRKKYYLEHKEKYKYDSKKYKIYYQKNKERLQLKSKKVYLLSKEKGRYSAWLNRTRDTRSQKAKIYRENNREKISKSKREKRQQNLEYKLACNLRARICRVIRSKEIKKDGSAIKDLGCSLREFHFYLEGKFKEGMSWENYGKFGWHIDHIVPLAFFDLTDREQLKQACHYTNLQPLWAKENYQKKDKLNYYDGTSDMVFEKVVEENIPETE
jgi:hypothetical protein